MASEGDWMKKFLLAVLTLVAVALAACSVPGLAATNRSGLQEGEGATACPEPAAGTKLLRLDEHGYCLLYPDEYSVERPNPEESALVVGSLLDVSNPRVYIKVTDGGGRTAGDAAQATIADFPGFDIVRSDRTIGGQDAVVLNGVPGQDISRQVIVVRDDALYHLTFVPASEDAGEVYARMEEVYKMVVDSLNFFKRER
jgi:hypothetical protein